MQIDESPPVRRPKDKLAPPAVVPNESKFGVSESLPWATEPQDMGSTTCAWCYRDIYQPAVPCSVRPVEGLARMKTTPGFGRRCQYELATRRPDLLTDTEAATILQRST